MKTWIFDEQTLDGAIAAWVEKQIASGHPKAVANATFVGAAIKDMLQTSTKLFKESNLAEPPLAGIIPSHAATEPTAPVKSGSKYERSDPSVLPDNFSIEDLKRGW